MSIFTAEELSTIERDADRASVQLLRLQVTQVTQALPSLEPDVADYASALLLKLERLINEQCVPMVGAGTRVSGPQFRVETIDALRHVFSQNRRESQPPSRRGGSNLLVYSEARKCSA